MTNIYSCINTTAINVSSPGKVPSCTTPPPGASQPLLCSPSCSLPVSPPPRCCTYSIPLLHPYTPTGARSAIACTVSLLRTLAEVTPSSVPPPPYQHQTLESTEQGLRLITGVKAASSPLLNSRPRADRSAGVLLVTVFPRTEKVLCQFVERGFH